MKKLLALMLALVLCVSMFAACGGDEPADTTGTPSTTKAPTPDTTTEPKPEDSTTPEDTGDDTTTPDTGDDTTDTTSEDDTTGNQTPDTDLAKDLYDVADPSKEQLAKENIGAIEAGKVPADYVTKSAIGITALSEITDLEGTYYLKNDISANDITVVGTFKGVLDGCGYTVTTSEPMFEIFGGIVRNLTIAGEISYSVDPKAPFANELINGAAVVNVKSTVNVKVEASDTTGVHASGFALKGTGEVIFYNCEFAGSVNNDYRAASNGRYCGGFFAEFGGLHEVDGDNESSKIILTNCTFSGSVEGSTHCGGLIGSVVQGTIGEFNSVAITGSVSALFEGSIGGIFGYLTGSSVSNMNFTNCYNDGEIKGILYEKDPKPMSAGGLAGSVNNSSQISTVMFKWCVNYKAIDASQHIGGLIGKCAPYVTFKECVNYGDLTAFEITPDTPSKTDNFVGGMLGFASGAKIQCSVESCVNYGDLTGNTQRVRMGGIIGHNESKTSGMIVSDCINFGDITSNYKSTAVNDADYRLGGIIAGGYGLNIVKNCVNFGDVTGYFHKSVQPVGGIIGMSHNQVNAGEIVENCINYGNVHTLADPIEGVLGGSQAAGIIGCLYGAGEFTIKGCVNVGTLNGYGVTADIAYQYNNNLNTALVFENNFYLENAYVEKLEEGCVYGVLGYGQTVDDYSVAAEVSAKATSFTKDQLADSTTAGLKATINTALGSEAYTFVTFTMPDGVTPFTGIVPTTLAEVLG